MLGGGFSLTDWLKDGILSVCDSYPPTPDGTLFGYPMPGAADLDKRNSQQEELDMAVSRAQTDDKKSLWIAVALLVVLTLASLVFAVVMYMNVDQYSKTAGDLQDERDKLGTDSQINQVRRLADPTKKGTTALGVITADMKWMGRLIGGEELANMDLAGVRKAAEAERDVMAEQLELIKQVSVQPEQFDINNGLSKVLVATVTEWQTLAGRFTQFANEQITEKQTLNQQIITLQQQIEQLRGELDKATTANEANLAVRQKLLNDQQARYEQYIQQLNGQIAETNAQAGKLKDDFEKLDKKYTQAGEEIQDLKRQLTSFQPKPDMETAALEPDGQVVSVVLRDRLAYINLGKDDHVYRGLTFSVYDSYEPIPRNGRGKGALEIIDIMDNVSKCRITDFNPTDPIMENDIIANVIWSHDKQYRFCVIGEFDLNGDGQPDADGREKIDDMIQAWGGVASEDMTVTTDFFVVGDPPRLPARPRDEDFDMNTEAAVAYRAAQQRVDAYQSIRDEAAELDIPTFNLQRFLAFVGQSSMAGSVTASR
ncbi:MAG: hypothetical protein JW709_00020 [Sedimentisphaerales bacterium]|nr:hypothetical protein [Sedimentisphaerales bacterium]